MLSENVQIYQYSICGYAPYTDQDDLRSTFYEIASEVPSPPYYNQVSDIDEKEPEESELAIGAIPGSDPRSEEQNVFELNVIDQHPEEIHIHAYSSEPLTEATERMYNRIAEITGEIEVRIFTIEGLIQHPFESLNLDIDVDINNIPNEEVSPMGIRFDYNDEETDFLLQKSAEEGGTTFRYGSVHHFPIDAESSFIEEQSQELAAIIRKLEP